MGFLKHLILKVQSMSFSNFLAIIRDTNHIFVLLIKINIVPNSDNKCDSHGLA